MEELFERAGEWRVVGVGFHDVCHVGPPFFDDVLVGEAGRGVVVRDALDGEQSVRFFVEEDGVVVNPRAAEFGGEIRPDFFVTPLVFAGEAGFEDHFEGDLLHSERAGSRER